MSSYNSVRWHGGAVIKSEAVGQIQLEEDPVVPNDTHRFPMVWGKPPTAASPPPSKLQASGARQAAAHLKAITEQRSKRGEHVVVRGHFGATSHSRTIEPFSFSHAVKTPSGQLVSIVSGMKTTSVPAAPVPSSATVTRLPTHELEPPFKQRVPQVVRQSGTLPRTFDLPRTAADARKLIRNVSAGPDKRIMSPRSGHARRQVVQGSLSRHPEVRSVAELSTPARVTSSRGSFAEAIKSASPGSRHSPMSAPKTGTLSRISSEMGRIGPSPQRARPGATRNSEVFTTQQVTCEPSLPGVAQGENTRKFYIRTHESVVCPSKTPVYSNLNLRSREMEVESGSASRPTARGDFQRTPRVKPRIPIEGPKLHTAMYTDGASTAARSDGMVKRPQSATTANISISNRSERLRAIAQQTLSGAASSSGIRLRSLTSPGIRTKTDSISRDHLTSVGPLTRHRIARTKYEEEEPLEDDWDLGQGSEPFRRRN